ncbi:hypothetical protein AMQ83_16245 [Paenibacillus riograndensis]|nr:hypothetical protein AMQ83_16245 [Paenibacillus riograndensis]
MGSFHSFHFCLQLAGFYQYGRYKEHCSVNDKYPADRNEGSEQSADNRPGHGCQLGRRLIKAESPPAEAGVNDLHNHGIYRRKHTGIEQAGSKTQDSEFYITRYKILQNISDPPADQADEQNKAKALAAAEPPPLWSHNYRGDTHSGEDDARA